MKIDSQMHILDEEFSNSFSEADIKNEPMLFNCDFEHAGRLGGRITQEFLNILPVSWKQGPLVIDTRVHMLMPGWFPCIPGWHHDDVPRTRADLQPNYGPGQFRSNHILMLVNGDICPTEFAVGEADLIEPPLGQIIYKEWHKQVELLLLNNVLRRVSVPSGKLVMFNDRAFHQGTKAVAGGWRYFVRASRYSTPEGVRIDRGNARTNEVRRQVQVYLENPEDGW